jgi:uncharacterized damage-inducible protein DinB
MNQRYVDYALYNIWANNRLINDLLEQYDELLGHQLVGSYPTIRATILHIWFAETGWLSRLNGNDWETTKVTKFEGTNKELFKEWQNTSYEFKTFVDQSELEKVINFDLKGEVFSIPTREIIQTVFNHGSFHRGQVVMMMRQLGVSEITQTDYIEWVREK